MGFLPKNADILPPCDDRVFKLILTPEESKPILIDLLTSVLHRRVTDVAVRNNEIPPEHSQERAERLDLNCMIDDGTQVDVEMHAHRIEEKPGGKNENVKGKTIYYLCDLHSSQPCKGKKRYDLLSRTCQITFCFYTVFPERKEFVNSFSLRHDIDNELLSDAIHIVFVELSKLREVMKKPVSDMTDLEKWAIFFRYADDPKYRETVNEVIASKEALKMAGNRLMSISQDERERAVMRSRRMAETDLESNLATAWDNGLEEGIQRGRREMARLMLANGEPEDKIMQYTGLSRSEIKKLRN